jgi:hypothetical protein
MSLPPLGARSAPPLDVMSAPPLMPRSCTQPGIGTAPHEPLVQAAAMHESLGIGHTAHEAPQLFGSVALVQAPWHRLKPAVQVMPQLVPLQVAVPFGSVGQAAQEVVPQLFTLVSGAHAPEQRWKPAAQVMPQLVPLQVAVPFGSVGQAAHEVVPQLFTLVFETHAPEQRW